MNGFSFLSECDGITIQTAEITVKNAKAVVQIAHGMAEHKERYFPFMEFLAENGISSIINDHRGHGEREMSEGRLGYFGKNGADALISDMRKVTETAKDLNPDTPVILLGHSMGALAARAYAWQYSTDIDGLILTGNPGMNSMAKSGVDMAKRAQEKRGERAMCRFLSIGTLVPFWLGAPSFKSKYNWISTDSDVVMKYDKSPLCGFEFTANGYEALLTLMLKANDESARTGNAKLPIMFFSGEKDPCMGGKKKLSSAINIMRNGGFENVGAKTYPNMRHEILNEIDRRQVYSDILSTVLSWLR